jgi:predicted 3-demethylubiquinone-9 3-methyltransferase (glyoxalase superfamily)
MNPITSCLRFDSNTELAMNFYTSIFANAKVLKEAYDQD